MKGVTNRERKGTFYWYAQIDGRKQYCGKNSKGKELAEAARAKFIAEQYEKRELSVGLNVRKPKLKTFMELSNWYMLRPQTLRMKSYQHKLYLVENLHRFFSKMLLAQIDTDILKDYREFRIREGMKDSTVNHEISLLRCMYHLARKRKKISPELMPGEFPEVRNASPPRRTITDNEYRRLRQHADQDFQDFLEVGMRQA